MLMLAIIGHTCADQLLPQLLMEQFDTFPIQCSEMQGLPSILSLFCNKFNKEALAIRRVYLYPPQTLFVVGILFSCCPCVHPCVRASVRP